MVKFEILNLKCGTKITSGFIFLLMNTVGEKIGTQKLFSSIHNSTDSVDCIT